MKLFYSPYSLKLRGAANSKTNSQLDGFLIKIQSPDFKAGYADCLPWRAFGDEGRKAQLSRLRAGKLNELLVRSLYYATLDGMARERRVSLFNAGVEVRSHYTCSDISELSEDFLIDLSERGFETIKVKVGRKPASEARLLSKLDNSSSFRWRLDFNGQGGEEFLEKGSEKFLACVEFVEDPCAFDPKKWRQLEKKYGIQVAQDSLGNSSTPVNRYTGIRVVKPARTSMRLRRKDVLTNSLDHPVGQSFAFWEAQQYVADWKKQPRDYGIKTTHLLRPNDFSRDIFDESPFFSFSDGYGVGFNKLLEKQKWTAL
jgi:O-succinylbenzoate synthase